MTDSCCAGRETTRSDSNTETSRDKQLSEARDSNSTAQASTESGNDSCCEGSTCKCDDSCLDQLARAICANDAGHVHDQGGDNASDKHTDCSTCCDDSDTAHYSDGDVHSEKKAEHHEHGHAEHLPASSPEHTHNMDHSCSHGLRRRRVNHVESTPETTSLPTEACGQHKSFARKRYQDTLTAFGCICKAMLAHGLQSCCTTKHAHKGHAASKFGRSSRRAPSVVSSKHRLSEDSCCKDNRQSVDSCCSGHHESVDSCCKDDQSGRSHIRAKCGSSPSSGSCCGHSDKADTPKASHGCGSACNEKLETAIDTLEVSALEKGVGAANDHAVLAIRGMTCTGCENKVIRVLRAIPAICNVKTSLVLCRAEFDFDNSASDLQALVQTIEKRTGFSIETIGGGSTRELRLNVDRTLVDELVAMRLPEGVERTLRVDKGTVCVVYDARVVGARRIIEYYSALSPNLAPDLPDPAITAGMKHIRTLALRTVASAALTIPVLVMAWAPLPPHPRAYAITSLTLATVVQTAITGPVYVSAFKSLFFSGLVETDLLIVLSTTAAYVYSVVAFAFGLHGHPLASGEFFETSTLLVTLIMVGQLVSAFARQRAITAISIRSLQQSTATLVHADEQEEVVDARLLQYGDRVRIAPDEAVITDGVVCEGMSEVDESMMTGEARPVSKVLGSKVIAGTVNGPSTLVMEVTRLPGENTISDIAAMVDDARFSRARVQATVDRVCGWFVPVVLSIAIITFLVWLAVGLAVRKQSGGEAAVTALTYAIAVLAICCPCAIGLAVPMVILIAGGVAAKIGLVFKAATTIESARKITHVVFDKTGTLTQGKLTVVASEIYDHPMFEVRAVIGELVKSSKHPVARAVAAHLGDVVVSEKAQVSKVEMVTGQGIQAVCYDGTLRGGSAKWLAMEDHPAVRPLLQKGLTTFCVTFDGQLVAAYGLEDALRPETVFVIDSLRKRNISVSILSGDHAAAVNKIAEALGIPDGHVQSACMPADKQAYIKMLLGRKDKVLFCGDGTNDAVALAQADIGVHLHTGEGAGFAASTAADVVLTHPSLTGILALLELSEAVNRRIMLNFAWSAVYNLVAILFASGAFVKARIAPAYAGLGEIVSVLPVVLVALQLKWFKSSV